MKKHPKDRSMHSGAAEGKAGKEKFMTARKWL